MLVTSADQRKSKVWAQRDARGGRVEWNQFVVVGTSSTGLALHSESPSGDGWTLKPPNNGSGLRSTRRVTRQSCAPNFPVLTQTHIEVTVAGGVLRIRARREQGPEHPARVGYRSEFRYGDSYGRSCWLREPRQTRYRPPTETGSSRSGSRPMRR